MAKQSLSNWKDRHRSIRYWLAVGLGSGLLRPAPGTWGSLAGIVLAYAMLYIGIDTLELIAWTFALCVIGIKSIDGIEHLTGVHDAPEIVIDEWAGVWIAVLPLTLLPASWLAWGTAFLLFRLFDIIKPWPIGWLDQKVGGGFGVMVDDIVAGVQAAILLYGLLYYGIL